MPLPPETPLGEEVKQATIDVLERVAQLLSGRVYSPRIKLLDVHQVSEACNLAVRTIQRMVSEHRFPKPLEGIGKDLWRESTLIAWMDRMDPNR